MGVSIKNLNILSDVNVEMGKTMAKACTNIKFNKVQLIHHMEKFLGHFDYLYYVV